MFTIYWLSLMKFINLTNECLNHFFVISNMTICKSIVKFVLSLTLLKKKKRQPLKNIYIYIYVYIYVIYKNLDF